jgi:ankyrin repeat protein
MFGSSRDNVGVINALIAAKADISVTEAQGLTAFVYAAMFNNAAVIPLLVAAGADVDGVHTEQAVTALMIAIEKRSVDATKALIAAKADVNATDTGGRSPLIFAVATGQVGMVEILIEAGADVNLRSDIGSALDIAEVVELKDIGHVLRRAGAVSWLRTVEESQDFVRVMVEGKYDEAFLNKVLSRGSKETKDVALFIATVIGDSPAIKSLIAAGASPSAMHRGTTALHCAVESGSKDTVADLLVGATDLSAVNVVGKTALQTAAQRKDREMVAALLAKANELKKK